MRNKHKPAQPNHEFLARLALVQHDPELLADVLPQARAGNVDAQYAAGLIYAEGRGVPPDPVEGYIWLSRAIAQGDEDAVLLRNMVMLQMSLEEIRTADQRLAREVWQ
jgi:TPR repeat protein